jgi:peptide/nickel transport system substrate-binding protein
MLLRSLAALLLVTSTAQAQDVCPRRGGELTIPFAPDPADLTPGKNAQYAPSLVFDEIYDTLLRIDHKGALGPGLATKYELANDNLSVVFTLRQGVMFHHGREFEAKDVVFTFERLLDPKFASPWAAQLRAIDKVEALDKYTVRMSFKEPFAPILNIVATAWYTAIVPYDFTPSNNLNQKASGTGPFELVEYVPDDHVTLKRNPVYWEKGYPCLDGVRFNIVPEHRARPDLCIEVLARHGLHGFPPFESVLPNAASKPGG